MSDEKIRVDFREDLDLETMAEAGRLLGKPLGDVIQSPDQPLAIAALVCVVKRRTDPSFTFERAKKLRPHEMDIVGGDDVPEVPGASNGAKLLASLEPSDSTPPT